MEFAEPGEQGFLTMQPLYDCGDMMSALDDTRLAGPPMIDAYRRTGQLRRHCLCGAVSIAIDGGLCRRRGGLPLQQVPAVCRRDVGRVRWPMADAVTVTGDVRAMPRRILPSAPSARVCGSNLWLRNTDDPKTAYELMPALFPEAADFPLISEIYIDCRPAYVPLTGDSPDEDPRRMGSGES
jgi:hypothetical protein